MQSDLITSLRRHVEQVDSMAPSLEEMLAPYETQGDELGGELSITTAMTSHGALSGELCDHDETSAEPSEVEVRERCGAEIEVFDLREPVESAAPTRPRRRAVVGGAVAAAILLVLGVVVVADGNSANVVTGAASPLAEPVPVPSLPDPTPPPEQVGPLASVVDSLGYRWSRVPYGEAGFGKGFEQRMSSVTVGGPGLVAVGQAGSAVARGAVWTSVDGRTWSQVPDDEAIFAHAPIHSVTAGGPGLVAVGVAFGDEDDRACPGSVPATRRRDCAAVWTSVDGLTWSRVPHDEAVFGGAAITSVTAGGPGLVAVGWDGHPHGTESNAVVWTSPDGITWSRVPHDEAIFGNSTGAWMWNVTAGGPGLVAVGYVVGEGRQEAAVWTSVDGVTWSRVPHSEATFGGGEMRSVAAGGPGLVAVGNANDDAAVWTSADGITWSRVPHDEEIFGGPIDQAMTSVTAAGRGLVAVGFDGVNDYSRSRVDDDLDAVVWTSVDGLTWSRVPHDEAVFGAGPKPVLEMNNVIAGGPGLVAVGANRVYDTSGATESDAAVLVATLED